ncbi:MAG: DNA translocase FtsK [Ruminococcus sp.]|nr:DNA translocase FtsK [Ruminococcus sp.]
MILVTFVQGGGMWNKLYEINRGMFGISAFLVGPEIIYVSIMIARDKSQNAVVTKIIQGVILMLLISGIVQILAVGSVDGHGFADKLRKLYENGVKLKGGGLCSALLGWPLLAIFKRVGAAIIIILLTFTFVMLLTNLTLIEFFIAITKPFRKGYSAVKETNKENSVVRAERAEERRAERERLQAEKQEKKKGSKIPPENISKEERKNKRVDVAKYIQDDDMTAVNNQKVDEIEHDPELDIVLPIHPVNAPKVTRKKMEETAKTTEDKQLKEIIKKALPEKKEDPLINPVFIESDGQTTFFEKDNAIAVYKTPPVSLLNYAKNNSDPAEIQTEIQGKSDTLVTTLQSFGIQSRIVDISRGPSVTRYELQPAAGVKVSKITGLSDDIALNLAAKGVRIEAPIPGKAAVGVEIPNKTRDTVSIRELIESEEYIKSEGKLCFAVGKDIEGNIIVGNIAKMPHMLIAGTTGSGKSVFTNSIIMNILYHASPDEVKLILIDPKQVEFPIYNGIPHLLIPVVTDARKAAGALNWAVIEMEKRYSLFADTGVRDLEEYNKYVENDELLEKMPQIVVIIDEFADLMMVASKEVEQSVLRIAQKARAAGMHLIIATQSPRVDVITGLIKSNIPSRVALKVSNFTDSRVILDIGGAEKLLGNGDMLYMPVGMDKPMRIQGSFVATSEVRDVVNFLKNQITAEYDEAVIEEIEKNIPMAKGEKPSYDDDGESGGSNLDPLFNEAVEAVLENGQASTSYLQRRLKLGYGRAARVMDEMEQMGIIGAPDGSKPRKVLITKDEWLEKQSMS